MQKVMHTHLTLVKRVARKVCITDRETEMRNDFTTYWIARKNPTMGNLQAALKAIRPYHMPTSWTTMDVRHAEMTQDALEWLYRTFDKKSGLA